MPESRHRTFGELEHAVNTCQRIDSGRIFPGGFEAIHCERVESAFFCVVGIFGRAEIPAFGIVEGRGDVDEFENVESRRDRDLVLQAVLHVIQ